MALISFHDWLQKHQESSAFTRARREAAFGLRPAQADFMSHSTPRPWELESLDKKVNGKKKKTKKKR